MRFLLELFVTLSFLSFQLTVSTRPEILSRFVNDLIHNENTPIVLTVKDCWNKYERVSFAKMVSTSIQFISNAKSLPILRNDFSNKIWFIVDMNCTDSVAFLNQVCKNFGKCEIEHFSFLVSLFQTNSLYFAHPFHWILLNIKENDHGFVDTLDAFTDSNIVLAIFNEDKQQYQLEQGQY